MSMKDLYLGRKAATRSVCPENPTGGKGAGGATEPVQGSAASAARDLGKGWKVNPSLRVAAGETITMADISGEGAITHIWMTPTGSWRQQILRFYWDHCETPAVECPMGDFFASGWGEFAQISSLAVCVNPGSGFNCYWRMPFRRGFRVTLENLTAEQVSIYYQITYELTDIPEEANYFHAQFRRVNPLPYKGVYTVAENISGSGHYVGVHMAWGVNNCRWWGEGEIKFFIDGDTEYPTICGTGTEDYFCGSYNFEDPHTHKAYLPFSTPYSGMPTVIVPDGLYKSQTRFGMYRWHITDPVFFENNLKVTIQALGWRSGGRYLPLQDDIASVVYFYLDKPYTVLPELPDADSLEII
jgi:hypothetical protein